jgi:hypothetical protein
MEIFCLGLIIFSVVVIVLGIIKVHELPGEIAKKKGHPQAEAIRICSLLGLIVFPFWMFALVWAYVRPVMTPISIEIDPEDELQTTPIASEGGQP